MTIRHREEVINVCLAECLRDLGVGAAGEQIEIVGKKRFLPDVLFDYKGLRCMIEGKFQDVPDAQNVVLKQTVERVESGIAHMALAAIYPVELREVEQDELPRRLAASRMKVGLCTVSRYLDVEWHEGGVGDVLDLFRRGHSELLEDDIVTRAVGFLSAGMEDLVRVLISNPTTVERIADYIGITDEPPKKKVGDSNDE